MTQKITLSDLSLHLLMKGKTTQLSSYIKDELYIFKKAIQRSRIARKIRKQEQNMLRGFSANSYFVAINKMLRHRADRDVINGGYVNALKDDRHLNSKLGNLHKRFLQTHKKELEAQLKKNLDCFNHNGALIMRGNGSKAFLCLLLIEYGYDIVSEKPHKEWGGEPLKCELGVSLYKDTLI